jgi:SAM-dependent methyltransferase
LLLTTAGTRVLPPPGQRVVKVFEHIACAAGQPLEPSARILDFGAGAGRHVGEQVHLSHEAGSVETAFLRRVEPPDYVLPFVDEDFDFVYSTSVMEHVLDPGSALAEIARVLRPGGLSIHVFPARWRPIEPHMLVPFGGRFQSFTLMRMWARLGIRNSFQRGLPATTTALANTQYAKTGISYPTATEWELRAAALFSAVEWSEPAYIRGSRHVSRLSRLLARVADAPGLQRCYRTLHTRVLVLRR